jgi:formylglycine-generating enzyme required for sulfatase activity
VAHAHTLLRCLGLSLCETGRRALLGEVSFGQSLLEISRDTLTRAGAELTAADLRGALHQLASAETAVYTEVLRQTAASLAGSDSTIREALRDYLRYWPSTIRQALRRPADPSGRAVPASLVFDDPLDLLKFLPARTPQFRPGRLAGLEDWELTRYCGIGTWSEAWAARTVLGTELTALKFVTEPAAVQLILENEALFTRVFALAGQSGIVPLRAVCPDPDLLYLETGYAPGYDLTGVMSDWRWRWGRPLPDAALNMIRRLTDIIGKAHTRKIVHRNLKPSNVLLMPTDGTRFTMWVSDFGWGQIAAHLTATRPPKAGAQHPTLRGAHTLLYTAPQVLAGEPPDPRDDVYSIGMIWYQLLHFDPSEPPPVGTHWMETLTPHGLTADQADLLAACLSKTAADRPADATALARRLTEIAAQPSPLTSSLPPSALPERRAASESIGAKLAAATTKSGPISAATPGTTPTAPPATHRPAPAASLEPDPFDTPLTGTSGPPSIGGSGPQSGILSSGPQSGILNSGPQSGLLSSGPQSGVLSSGPPSGLLNSGSTGGLLNSGPASGSFIFDSGPLSGASGPPSVGGAKPPGPVSTVMPASVASGARPSSGMITNSIGMVFVLIPAGEFMMGTSESEPIRGADDEHPQHRVRILRPFYLSSFPVTQAQYKKVTGINPAHFSEARGGGPNHPVESVTWHEAELFCVKLGLLPDEAKIKHAYLLPTEAEWEYACRAGTTTPFWCGEKLIPQVASFASSAGRYSKAATPGSTCPVGQLLPNPWGLYDMHGNVQEWVQDWYEEAYYAESPVDDPGGPKASAVKVTRGGSWQSFGTDCRSAARMVRPPERASNQIGFRVVMLASDKR